MLYCRYLIDCVKCPFSVLRDCHLNKYILNNNNTLLYVSAYVLCIVFCVVQLFSSYWNNKLTY